MFVLVSLYCWLRLFEYFLSHFLKRKQLFLSSSHFSYLFNASRRLFCILSSPSHVTYYPIKDHRRERIKCENNLGCYINEDSTVISLTQLQLILEEVMKLTALDQTLFNSAPQILKDKVYSESIAQFPLWHETALNYGSCIYHLWLDICCDEHWTWSE